MTAKTDQDIIDQLKNGTARTEEEALEVIYRKCYPMVKAMIVKNNGAAKDAEDVFQDGLIAFYTQIKQGKLELHCSISTYLYSVCRNQWLKRLRKTKREVALTDQEEIVPIEEDLVEKMLLKERNHELAKALKQLAEECRSILLGFYFERWSIRKITDWLGLASEQVTKNKKAKCLKKIRENLKTN